MPHAPSLANQTSHMHRRRILRRSGQLHRQQLLLRNLRLHQQSYCLDSHPPYVIFRPSSPTWMTALGYAQHPDVDFYKPYQMIMPYTSSPCCAFGMNSGYHIRQRSNCQAHPPHHRIEVDPNHCHFTLPPEAKERLVMELQRGWAQHDPVSDFVTGNNGRLDQLGAQRVPPSSSLSQQLLRQDGRQT
jgi:hypothetical protein